MRMKKTKKIKRKSNKQKTETKFKDLELIITPQRVIMLLLNLTAFPECFNSKTGQYSFDIFF